MSRTKVDDYTLFLATAMRIGLIQTASSGPTAHLKSAGKPGDALKEDTDFVRLLKHDVEDAHFVLLCALLPNLESLAVNGGSIYTALEWYTLLSRAKGALQKVESLSICGTMPRVEWSVSGATMQVLDILPRLQCLFLGNMSVQGHCHTLEHLPSKQLRQFMFSPRAVRHRLLKKMFAGQQAKSLFYTPNYDALDTINAGAAFTEAQIVEALGASTATMEKLIISPTAPSIDPHTREYSNLKSLVIPHLCLLPTVEGYPSLDDIVENLRLVMPRSVSRLHLRHLSLIHI